MYVYKIINPTAQIRIRVRIRLNWKL